MLKMDRGDFNKGIPDSTRARRAKQEAYRKELDKQIQAKKLMQENRRENCGGKNTTMFTPDPDKYHRREASVIAKCPQTYQSPNFHDGQIPLQDTNSEANYLSPGSLMWHQDLYNQQCFNKPYNGGFHQQMNDIDNFNEPHPVAVANLHEHHKNIPQRLKSLRSPKVQAPIPDISPEHMKYIQQVLPGFSLPAPSPSPQPDTSNCVVDLNEPDDWNGAIDYTLASTNSNMRVMSTESDSSISNDQAFSSGTVSESSSVENVIEPPGKVHVSQTYEQLQAGVKVSRKQYKVELQQQIDEKKRRAEEKRIKDEEEEKKYQEKIRLQQEQMRREHEDELRKQEEKQQESEKKLALVIKQTEHRKAQEEQKAKKDQAIQLQLLTKPKVETVAETLTSTESIESIGEFFDTTMKSESSTYINPDDREIPVVAKRLRESMVSKESDSVCRSQSVLTDDMDDIIGVDTQVDVHSKVEYFEPVSASSYLTARVESSFPCSDVLPELPYPQEPQCSARTRALAIRSAPCPTTTNAAGLQFLSSLKTYLTSEKSKLDTRIRLSKSNEGL